MANSSSNSNAFTLSNEQQAILATLPLPSQEGQNPHRPPLSRSSRSGQLVRIAAAAGAGKTTTLLELAERAAANHYDTIYYLTFAKAAAKDAMERFQNRPMLQQLARTLHSAAYHLLKDLDHRERIQDADEEEEEDRAMHKT
jgi:ATP-dependent exoDNAse (exonuclease V) beta subunit